MVLYVYDYFLLNFVVICLISFVFLGVLTLLVFDHGKGEKGPADAGFPISPQVSQKVFILG